MASDLSGPLRVLTQKLYVLEVAQPPWADDLGQRSALVTAAVSDAHTREASVAERQKVVSIHAPISYVRRKGVQGLWFPLGKEGNRPQIAESMRLT